MARVPAWIEALAAVPACRSRSGRRQPLVAVLATACAALLGGARGYTAMADWGRNSAAAQPAVAAALGFTHQPLPAAATSFPVVRRLDRAPVAAVLGAWAEAVLVAPAQAAAEAMTAAREAVADAGARAGQTLRGSRKQGAPGVHLLSAVRHRLGLTLGPAGVDDKTHAIAVAPIVVAAVVMAGRIVPLDALLTQREVAQTISAGGGDSVMAVQANQPGRYPAVATLFATPVAAAPRPAVTRPG